MRRSIAFLAPVLAVGLLSGCARDSTLRCESDERYAGATTAPPLSIPDDLNVPDETNALRVPDSLPTDGEPEPGRCIESPPDFFDDVAEG